MDCIFFFFVLDVDFFKSFSDCAFLFSLLVGTASFIAKRFFTKAFLCFKKTWQNPESPTNCMPLIPRDTEREHVLAESQDVKVVWD
jgi:hypothetical protein